MSWKGVPKKENYFPLFAEDWNLLVESVDELYYMLQTRVQALVGGYVVSDLNPLVDSLYSLGSRNLRFLNVYARNVFVDDKPVLKDGDPIYVEDLLPPARETLKHILMNTVLARDLYETKSIELCFEASNGVLEVFVPPNFYTTIVRGWYAVSTGTSGVARLKGAYSLTPVALIPLSVPAISVPDIFLRLYYDEPLVLYYSGASLGSYLQLLLNVLEEWTRVTVRPPPGNVSGINPYDPAWMPPDGWTHVWEFTDPHQVNEAFNFPCKREVVEGGVLSWALPEGMSAGAERFIENQSWTRAAVCLKINIMEVLADYGSFIYFNPVPTTNDFAYVDFNLTAGSTDVTVVDGVGTGSATFTPPDDWIVIVVENVPGGSAWCRVYDRNKNIIAEVGLEKRTTVPPAYEDMWFEVHNATADGTWDIDIDWIALKY